MGLLLELFPQMFSDKFFVSQDVVQFCYFLFELNFSETGFSDRRPHFLQTVGPGLE
jgi:hypothetical protein